MISPAEQLHFERVCRDMLLSDRERDGIGRLNEKRLHNMLKTFVCEDRSCHEVRLSPRSGDGRSRGFVADVLCDRDIFEIQTGSLYPLRDKIEFYLTETDYRVTVLHPLIAQKHVTYLAEADAQVVRQVSSPKHEGALDMIAQLYSLLPYLGEPRLRLRAPLLEVEEFRIQKKRGRRRAERYEMIPTGLIDILDFSSSSDLAAYLPEGLPLEFTAAEFGRVAHLRGIDVYSALKVFVAADLLRQVGTRGRAAVYGKAGDTSGGTF